MNANLNANYLAILLWVGSLLVQFAVYMWLAQRQRGQGDQQVLDLSEKHDRLEDDHGKLESRVLQLETQVANVRGWLQGSFGKIINGGDR